MKNQVLKLLLLARPMDTAAHWREALHELEAPVDTHTHEQHEPADIAPEDAAAIPVCNILLDAVDAVVPHLPEYSTLKPQLEALLEFCRIAYPLETDRMLRIWLQRGASSSSTAFRTWLLEWISSKKPFQLKDDQQNNDSKRQQQQWQHTLYAAMAMEERVELKRTIVKLVHELGPMQPDKTEDLAVLDNQEQLSSVEELLDVYWNHAHELAPFTLLCAARLHTLANNQSAPGTGASRGFVQLTDGVLVRLRWSKLLKPIFFQGLLDRCVALKVFQTSVSRDLFDLHEALLLQVKEMSWTTRNGLLERLGTVEERLEDAYQANTAHFLTKKPISKTSWTVTSQPHGQAFLSLVVTQQRLVLLDLERDLEDAPSHLFSHILLSFGVIMSSLLSSDPQSSDAVLGNAVKSLFALFDLRKDTESCYFSAALIVELRLTQHPIWTRAPKLFAEIAESLNEALATEADAQKRWVLTTMLQQLLLECDLAVVRQNLPVLVSILSPRLLSLTRIRLQVVQQCE